MSKTVNPLAAATMAVLALLPAGAARAAGPPPTADDVAVRNSAIVAKTPGTDGVFVVQANGDILHVQSGMLCPAGFKTVDFWHAEIFSPPGTGTDVGCDYDRADAQGHARSKLTLFATKSDGSSLDQAFAADQADLLKASPDAQFSGPALTVKTAPGAKPAANDPFGDFRSAEYRLLIDGVHYINDVIVTLHAGWVIEIRATYATDAVGVEGAKLAVGDAVTPTIAFITITSGFKSAPVAWSAPGT